MTAVSSHGALQEKDSQKRGTLLPSLSHDCMVVVMIAACLLK